jgi:hypothetical protein
VEGKVTPDSLLVRFEPSLNRAIDFAIGEGLIRRSSGSQILLSEQGRALAIELSRSESAYQTEKLFIDTVRFRITEKFVTAMFQRRS